MSVPITNPCKRCRIGGACAGEYCWPVMPPCAMLVEAHSTAPNTARDEIAAAEMLCKIYFDIAASCIGEDALRQRVAAATSPVA